MRETAVVSNPMGVMLDGSIFVITPVNLFNTTKFPVAESCIPTESKIKSRPVWSVVKVFDKKSIALLWLVAVSRCWNKVKVFVFASAKAASLMADVIAEGLPPEASVNKTVVMGLTGTPT